MNSSTYLFMWITGMFSLGIAPFWIAILYMQKNDLKKENQELWKEVEEYREKQKQERYENLGITYTAKKD